MRRLLALVVAGLAAVPAAAAADVRIDGHGWGHGVGLSQWGAYGYALVEGRDFGWIVGHYFPGTTLDRAPASRIRVRLKESSSIKLCSATRARDASRRRTVKLNELRSYSFLPWRADGLRIVDATTGRTRAHLVAPVRVSGGTSTCLRGRAENGRTNGTYRGAMVLLRDGGAVLAINDLSLRQYLYGVVPSEVPASWPAEALKAQAVAARGYAVRAIKPTAPFDVLADTRSQVYGGAGAETLATSTAVDQTDPLVATYQGAVAATYFSSSSGGRTAAVEEGFSGATPVPYLVSVDDPYDTKSPYHDWSVTLTDKDAANKLGSWVQGDLVDVEVISRSPSGRAATVRITGSDGEREVTGFDLRARLGLRSTWFTITSTEPSATPTPTPTP